MSQACGPESSGSHCPFQASPGRAGRVHLVVLIVVDTRAAGRGALIDRNAVNSADGGHLTLLERWRSPFSILDTVTTFAES